MSERNIVKVINRYGSDGSIALAARISYGAKHVESERVEPIINGLIANKEGTPFEFARVAMLLHGLICLPDHCGA